MVLNKKNGADWLKTHLKITYFQIFHPVQMQRVSETQCIYTRLLRYFRFQPVAFATHRTPCKYKDLPDWLSEKYGFEDLEHFRRKLKKKIFNFSVPLLYNAEYRIMRRPRWKISFAPCYLRWPCVKNFCITFQEYVDYSSFFHFKVRAGNSSRGNPNHLFPPKLHGVVKWYGTEKK